MQNSLEASLTNQIELMPGKNLQRLLRKIDPERETIHKITCYNFALICKINLSKPALKLT